MLKKIIFSFFIFFLISCASTVQIQDVQVKGPVGLKQIKGKYAGYVQTGGWQLESKASGFACSAWSFDVDINQVFYNSMTQLLNDSFEDIKIFNRILSKNELREQGYKAQVSILQSNASSSFNVIPGFWTVKIETTIDLNTIVSALGNSGLQFQNDVNSNGIGSNENLIGCDASEGTQIAVNQAISKISEIGALYIREGIRSVEDDKIN